MRWSFRVLVLLMVVCLGPARAARAAPPPVNPFTAPSGAAAMHGDSAASDTTPLPGPGAGAVRQRFVGLGGPCPSILIGGNGLPVAVCTSALTRAPVAYLLNPATGSPLASLALQKGNLFAGVYPYLDQDDRIVFVDGSGSLLRIAHEQGAGGHWHLRVAQRTPLRPALATVCPTQDCGGIVGLSPDWDGRVWFATDGGAAGFVAPGGTVHVIALGAGEHVGNSIATAPTGTAIATDHALYLLRAGARGEPSVVWRSAYDRGPARKPGQLSQGTGSTPTFFGPATGFEYLTIVDNASPTEHLLVYAVDPAAGHSRLPSSREAPKLVCEQPVLTAGASGSENSPIGAGRAVFVASTYGYPYPAVPDYAGQSSPRSAPFRGGLTRVDVRADGSGCDTVWSSAVRSAAVPKLSLADGFIYTVERRSFTGSAVTGPLDRFRSIALDAATGELRASHPEAFSSLFDTLQLAGNIGPGRALWQGTLFGLVRIAPR
jgi:hypothetical protein